jgi:hypothetical protein
MEEDNINETIKEEVATATEDKTMALPTHFLFALSNREEEKPLSRSTSFLFLSYFVYNLYFIIGTSVWLAWKCPVPLLTPVVDKAHPRLS